MLGTTFGFGLSRRKAKYIDLGAAKRFGDIQALMLNHWASSIRLTARRSMRYQSNPDKASPPGTPPFAHDKRLAGRRKVDRIRGNAAMLRRMIDYGYKDSTKRTVSVGPITVQEPSVPELHEFGGDWKNERRRKRKLGDGGEIKVIPRSKMRTFKTAKPVRGDREKRAVVYIKLRTTAQVRRANEINASLYGPTTLRYKARPYMAPAFRKMSTPKRIQKYMVSAAKNMPVPRSDV